MTRSPQAALLATVIAMVLAAPAAFAQDPGAPPSEPTAAAATTAPEDRKLGWADVDSNQDGNVGKDESAAVPALGQVFDQADVDADGQLTPQEYQAFVAKVQADGGAPTPTGAGNASDSGQ
ncbi:EF-hand domain-containing protein [Lysobacter sp. A3-1-A15]|uniref:EF-hand domain-containing protein n=1 Tax=Novilysobacter viscosus TaxID=3098602 RepID=UPI002EDAEE72